MNNANQPSTDFDADSFTAVGKALDSWMPVALAPAGDWNDGEDKRALSWTLSDRPSVGAVL